jgi:hemolysin activation/secretion protein
VQRLQREQLEQMLQEQRLKQQPVKPEIEVPAAPAAATASQTRNIPVKGFLLDPSAILSEAEIRSVLAPFEGKTLSLADLFEAVAGLNKLYTEKEMPTARAFLPPQDIKDGMVKIRLVEARLGEFHVGPVKQVSPEFIVTRMSLASGDLVSVKQLESDLMRFNRLHDTQLRASVQPGKTGGTTDVQLEAAEAKRYQYSVFADNAGAYSVGNARWGLTARVSGLTGRSDSLQFSAVTSEGSDSFNLGYSAPLNRNDLKLDVSYSQGGIKVVEGAFVPLDVSGTSHDFSVGLTQPVVVDAQGLWNVYGRLSSKESISKFGGATQQNIDLAVLTLGSTKERQTESAAWTVDVNLNTGMTILGGEEDFFALRVKSAWMGHLSTRTQLLLRGDLQVSPTELIPSAEQFQLGGSASVRGYSEGLLSGRSGYLTSVELRYALQNPENYLTRSPNTPLFTGLLFLDHGGDFPFRPEPLEDATHDDFLTGAGFGLNMDWKNRVSAKLAVAWPLRHNAGETVSHEPRLHASLSFNWP